MGSLLANQRSVSCMNPLNEDVMRCASSSISMISVMLSDQFVEAVGECTCNCNGSGLSIRLVIWTQWECVVTAAEGRAASVRASIVHNWGVSLCFIPPAVRSSKLRSWYDKNLCRFKERNKNTFYSLCRTLNIKTLELKWLTMNNIIQIQAWNCDNDDFPNCLPRSEQR